ncbi:SIMPL domain-containing protein [Gammaproteobacteria bacterium]|nr:SIMPL domain-containing protein [Gammaproteobacteria bacterium]
MINIRTPILLLLGSMLYGSAAAAEDAPITYDRVTLSVNTEKQVDNDTVVAQLFSEREGEQTSQLASEINENIAWALERVKNVDAVSAQTTGYHTQPVYQKQKIIGWRVRQSIKLESQDTTALGELIGELQSRLAMGSISYTISPDLRARAEDSLITQAIVSFGNRARLIAKELGRPGYRIVRLDIVTTGTPVRPRAFQRMAVSVEAADNVTPPVLDSGVQVVRVGINGVIELKLN